MSLHMNMGHWRTRSAMASLFHNSKEGAGGLAFSVRRGLRDRPRTEGILPRVAGVTLIVLICWLCGASPGYTQGQEHKHHVPGLDKISGGSTNQAFSGIVQSLDMKRNILNVNTVQGGVTEIFPIKKGMKVETADGDKIKLEDVKPGTNVLIYYSQKGDRRTVKQIVVLAAEKVAAKKANPHS